MKTLSELNTKWWYRLVKVIFVFLFIIVLLIANSLIFSSEKFKQVSIEKTKISCTYGDKKEFMADKMDSYLLLDSTYFPNGEFNYKHFFEIQFNEHNIRKIINTCYPQQDNYFDIFAYQRVMEILGDDRLKLNKEERANFISDADMEKLDTEIIKIENTYGSNKIQYLDYSVKLFDISPVFSFIPFFKIFLLTNIIILTVFEIFRRAFYYITLGSLRPKK